MVIRPVDIELRVRDRLDRAKAGAPVEDSTIELKEAWIDPAKAARRLAAHANASRGEPFIWVIGAKEDGTVVGAKREELANILPSITAHFDGRLSPECLRTDVIPYGAGTVVAVTFASDRAPYVVLRGNEDLDVPWREGTRTRSAKRHELLRMLQPSIALPHWTPLGLEVSFFNGGWRLVMTAEVVPQDKEVVLLSHGSSLQAAVDDSAFVYLVNVSFPFVRDDVRTGPVEYSPVGAHLQGPAWVDVQGTLPRRPRPATIARVQVKGDLRVARSTTRLHLDAAFVWPVPEGSQINPMGHAINLAPIVAMPID
ncbi:MAG: AlbA family DNA-binding domain-containing protein [Polyangiaceae bacterium]